jgi:hypothetical protein
MLTTVKRILPFLICLAALAVYVIAARQHPIGAYATETDFYHLYGPDAERLAAGEFPQNPYQGPGYPALVAVVAKFTGDTFTAGKWISVVCAVMTILLAYLLFARLCGYWTGVGAAALVAVAPLFPQYAISATTDAVFLVLVLAALVVLIEERINARWRAIGAGAIAGLAYLTRYNGLFLVVAGLVAIVLFNLFSLDWRPRIKFGLLFVGIFLLTASPWFYANYRHRGSPLYNANYLNIATVFYPELVDGRWNQDATRGLEERFRSFGDVLRYDPVRLMRGYPVNLWQSLRLSALSDLVSPWVAIAALIGIVIAVIERRSRKTLVVLTAALLYLLLMGLNHWETRYYFFLMVIYSGFAVYAVLRLLEWVQSRGIMTRRAFVLLPLALCVAMWWSSFAMARGDMKEFLGGQPTEVIAACEYFQGQGISRARVLARKPHLASICRQQWVFFPDVESIDQLREWLVTHEVDYVAFGVREAKARPELKALRDPRRAPPWLRPVWQNKDPLLILYRPELSPESPSSSPAN